MELGVELIGDGVFRGAYQVAIPHSIPSPIKKAIKVQFDILKG